MPERCGNVRNLQFLTSPCPIEPAPQMQIVDCQPQRHAAAILAILNEAIANSTAVYDYHARPASAMHEWFAAKAAGDFPVLGIEDADGSLLGFATYGTFRARAAYHYTVEHSVYVRHDQRGRGFGALLLAAVIERARAQDRHVLIGGIDAGNAASIALHTRFGFRHVGTVEHAGFKFGRWLDLAFYQLVLDVPLAPREGTRCD